MSIEILQEPATLPPSPTPTLSQEPKAPLSLRAAHLQCWRPALLRAGLWGTQWESRIRVRGCNAEHRENRNHIEKSLEALSGLHNGLCSFLPHCVADGRTFCLCLKSKAAALPLCWPVTRFSLFVKSLPQYKTMKGDSGKEGCKGDCEGFVHPKKSSTIIYSNGPYARKCF